MATYHGGALGGFSGKVGSIIGSHWRDIDYIKGLHKRINRNSPAQLAQKEKWKMMVTFLSPLQAVLERGLSREDTRTKTAYNLALGYNLRYSVIKGEKGFEIDYKNILLSRGSLPGAAEIKVENGPEREFVVSWSPVLASPMVSGEDMVTVVMNCYATEYHIIQTGERQDGMARLPFPEELEGKNFHFFIFFTSPEGNSSLTYYAGERAATNISIEQEEV